MTPSKKLAIERYGCGLAVIIGIGVMFYGAVVIPAWPYFQLDAVLTPAELANEARRDATLAMLKKSSDAWWPFWTGIGLAVAAFGAIGLWRSRETSVSNSPAP